MANSEQHIYFGGPIFDGETLLEAHAALFHDGRFKQILPADHIADLPDQSGQRFNLKGDIFSIGYVDLQVNGGDGIMFNAAPTVETLSRIAAAHRRLGATAILPTLITDRPGITQEAIFAVTEAIASGLVGLAGLHLEGPHLSVARKGAHDPALIRPMEEEDLKLLCAAANSLPALMMTIAPESVTLAQLRQLVDAGAIVSLGHSNADYETCCAYFAAGASCVTHLFNAMSQLGNREPGLVGAALACPSVSAGLIADGVHVHPTTMRLAWDAAVAARQKQDNGEAVGEIFLVSDAMAVAGTDLMEFTLGGNTVRRTDGRLIRHVEADPEPVLAGADLDLTTALRVLRDQVGLDLAETLRAATSVPAKMIGRPSALSSDVHDKAQIREQDCIRIKPDLSLAAPVI